jgi:Transposase DDE domain
MTKAAGQAGSDPVVGEQMISRDRYHQSDTQAPAHPEHADPEPAGPEHAGAQPAEHHAADQDNTAAEPMADPRCAASDQDGQASGATTEPASQQHDGPQQGTGLEVYGDSAYGTAAARAAYRAGGHDTVIKPKPLRPAIEDGYTLDDFAIDEQASALTCPAGHTRPLSATRTVSFGTLCAGCPLRTRCTTAAKGRSMTLHPHENLLRAARAHARTPQFTQAYPTRSIVERIIAWTATQNGRRIKLRYLGVTKNHAWLRTRTAAINLRTLIKHGLTRQDGAWVVLT